METVSLTFDDLDLVVGPFEFAGAYGVVGMVEDAIFEESQTIYERFHRRMINLFGHAAPVVQGGLDPLAVAV
jgi:hypothetical protein